MMSSDTSKLPIIHPSVECPRCHTVFRFETLRGSDITMAECLHCGVTLLVELFLEMVMQVTAYDGPDGLYKVMQEAKSRYNDEKVKAERAERYLRTQIQLVGEVQAANSLLAQGRPREAMTALQGLYKRNLDIGHRALLDLHLGNACEQLGQEAEAESYWTMGLERARRAQFPSRGDGSQDVHLSDENMKYLDVEAACLGNLGKCHAKRGDFGRAEELLRQSLSIYQKIRGTRGIANQTYFLATIAAFTRRSEDAIAGFQRAMQLYNELGDAALAGRCRASLQELGR
jgi:tetratricopeptide (TPR) repeat protein